MNSITIKRAAATWLPEAAAVILALIALRKGNPYGYYVLLRWVTSPIFVWIAWKAYSRGYGLLLAIAVGIQASTSTLFFASCWIGENGKSPTSP